jgi:hypothetical protein
MTTHVELSEGTDIRERIARVPYLIHAALILLALNLAVVVWFYFWFYFSPVLPSADKQVLTKQNRSVQTYKQSPFAPLPAPKPRRAVKTPERIEPVLPDDATRQYIPAFGSPASNGN